MNSSSNASGTTPQELTALLTGVGVFEPTERALILCAGEDRVRWLNGMVTNHVGALKKNEGCYAFVLNAQGRIQGDMNIFQREDALWLDTDRAQVETLTAFLDRFIIMDDVTLTPAPAMARLGVAGPQVAAVMEKIGLAVKELQPLQMATLPWDGKNVTVVAAHRPLVPRYEIWAEPEHLPAIRQALLDAGAVPCEAEAVEQLRILEGTPAYGKDITAKDLPQETNQMRALHFSKGCYLGQEIVERIRSRGNVHRTFTGFVLDAAEIYTPHTPEEKLPITTDGQAVGDVTSAAKIIFPDGREKCFAMGYMRREILEKKAELECNGAPAVAVMLPFKGQASELGHA